MGWIRRAHRCAKPRTREDGTDVSVGDIWECDDCHLRWQYQLLFGWIIHSRPATWPQPEQVDEAGAEEA